MRFGLEIMSFMPSSRIRVFNYIQGESELGRPVQTTTLEHYKPIKSKRSEEENFCNFKPPDFKASSKIARDCIVRDCAREMQFFDHPYKLTDF